MQPPALNENLALFLDFDGTLVNLAPTPDSIVVPEGLASVLERLLRRQGGAVAIVSGRALNDVFGYLQPYMGPGAGSHGLELRMADGHMVEPEPGVGSVAQAILAQAQELAKTNSSLIAEQKAWSASLHYRNAPELEAECAAVMHKAVAAHEGWEVIHGKMVFEARPMDVTKGTAVEAMMAQPPFAGRVPVFIGDDRTDEDGMRAAMALGGYGIKVGTGESVADYRLDDPEAVIAYLENYVEQGG
jgi:trehalose 6-phosphate phosphatase